MLVMEEEADDGTTDVHRQSAMNGGKKKRMRAMDEFDCWRRREETITMVTRPVNQPISHALLPSLTHRQVVCSCPLRSEFITADVTGYSYMLVNHYCRRHVGERRLLFMQSPVITANATVTTYRTLANSISIFFKKHFGLIWTSHKMLLNVKVVKK